MSRPKSPSYKPGYEAGTWKVVCDRCGFLKRNYQLKKEWTGLMTCEACFDIKQPLLDLKAPKEDISVPFVKPDRSNPGFLEEPPFNPFTDNVI